MLTEGERTVHDLGDGHGRRNAPGRPRVAHHVPRQIEHALGRFFDAGQPLGGLRRQGVGVSLQLVGVGHDGGQGIVELVHDSGRQLPEGRQLFRLDHAGAKIREISFVSLDGFERPGLLEEALQEVRGPQQEVLFLRRLGTIATQAQRGGVRSNGHHPLVG